MRTTYKALAHTVAGLVAVQAAVMVFAIAGLYTWIEDGNTLSAAAMEDESLDFQGVIGFMLHGLIGTIVIPLLALVLLVVSFFAKVPGGVAWAGGVLGLVVLQVALGLFGHALPLLGLLHGLNALVLFSVAIMAGRRVGAAAGDRTPVHA